MSDVLLATKIRIPPLRSNLIQRINLIQRLNEGLVQNRRLTILSAPAGYGKSTLLSEWVSQLGCPVAWLSLEKEENTPARFWTYFVAALATLPYLQRSGFGDSILQALQSARPPPMDVLLANLVNDISTLEERSILVLDDFHSIKEGQIHKNLVFLIDHLPLSSCSLHLVLASRMDPPWPLARWRVRGELVEIRTADLRFNIEEAADFLNQVMKLGLSAENVRVLEHRTEGWIAGLQLTALSLQGREDIQEFIQSFTGSNRFIFDYLVEEVLSRQKPDVKEFLLKTSILERLSAPLCNFILGRSDSQGILDQLEKSNLFLVPLDDARIWYRYHLLFADLLSASLRRVHSKIIPELHRRACEWLEENGFLSEALVHALAAGDLDRLAKIVERYAFTVMEAYEASSLLSWLNSLPDHVTNSYPWLNIARAWLLAYLGMQDRIEQAIEVAENCADIGDQRIRGYIAAMRTLAGELDSRQYQDGILQASKALELLPADEFRARAFVCYHLANLLAWQGDATPALMRLEEAFSLSRFTGDDDMAMTAQFEIANILRFQGKLKESMHIYDTCDMTLREVDAQVSTRRLPSFPLCYALLQKAQICLEWNELEKALHLAREGIRLCKAWGYCDFLYNGWVIYANVLYEIGDLDGALSAIHETQHIFPQTPADGRVSALETLINQARGDWISTTAWLSACRMSPADTPDFIHRVEYYLFAVILARQGKLDEARQILDRLLGIVKNAGAVTLAINILAEQAVILQELGEDEQAFHSIQSALKLAEPERFIRVFVNKGTGMERLLRKAATADISSRYVKMLLETLVEQGDKVLAGNVPPSITKYGTRSQPLIEPLSERELEVLRLLDSALTSEEISRELFVSVSTIRTHIRNIYSKLDVHGRIEAIQKAKELHLI